MKTRLLAFIPLSVLASLLFFGCSSTTKDTSVEATKAQLRDAMQNGLMSREDYKRAIEQLETLERTQPQ